MRYDAVFLDIDGTLLWVDLDITGYIEDLAPYSGNAGMTAEELGIEAPVEVPTDVAGRRISFNPYPESEVVLRRLREMETRILAVSNWDIELENLLDDLGWSGYFDGVIASAVVGVEKPEVGIFEEALRVGGISRDRVVHVGNDLFTDVMGASDAGIDAVLVDRGGALEAPEATFVLPDLGGLPGIVEG